LRSYLYAHHSAGLECEAFGASGLTSHAPNVDHPGQAAAEAMQEQERLANEEVEKRLKAALTAKKPLNSASRVASPGATAADVPVDSKSPVQDTVPKEDMVMDSEPTPPASAPPAPEVTFSV
jgi:hypothetical protein